MSYGTNAPVGFSAYRSTGSSVSSGAQDTFFINPSVAGNAIGCNELVLIVDGYILSAAFSPATDFTNGISQTTVASTLVDEITSFGTAILGVFTGCEYQTTGNQPYPYQRLNYWPGASAASVVPNTTVRAFVNTDIQQLYDVQMDNGTAISSATAQSYVGSNVGFNYTVNAQANGVGSPYSTATGYSYCSINQDSIANDSTLPWRIVGITDNVLNWNSKTGLVAAQYTNFLVKMNLDFLRQTTGT